MVSILILGSMAYYSLTGVKLAANAVFALATYDWRTSSDSADRNNAIGLIPGSPVSLDMVCYTENYVAEGFESLIGNWCLTEEENAKLAWGMRADLEGVDLLEFMKFWAQCQKFSKNRLEDPEIRLALG